MSTELKDFAEDRFVIGEMGRGPEVEPEVDGRDKMESVGEGGWPAGNGILENSVTGERVCSSSGGVWPGKASGERVGGVKKVNEPSLSLEPSEVPLDRLRSGATCVSCSLTSATANGPVDDRKTGDRVSPGSAILGDEGVCVRGVERGEMGGSRLSWALLGKARGEGK